MHVLLTDLLTCPRCGPDFGLILLSREMRDRRVLEGFLGCANCRDRWTIEAGFGEFRAPLGTRPSDSGQAADRVGGGERGEGEPVRIAALLGVSEGPAYVLLTGPPVRYAAEVAGLVEHLEVIAADPSLAGADERSGVSRLAVAEVLPFHNARLHGVWLSGDAADSLLEEAARVLWPLGRLVLEPAPPNAESRLAAAGLRIIARREDTIVATRAN